MLGATKMRISYTYLNYLIVLGMLLGIFIFYLLPEQFFNSSLEKSHCLHNIWFSKPCPGCGMTRAFYHSLHLNFSTAVKLNPSIILFYACLFTEFIFRLHQSKWNARVRLIMYVLLCISLFTTYFIRLIY
jgi:dipeptide/tripeptide permease